jgi:hypothetical protein
MATTEIQQGALALVYGSPSMDIQINGGTAMTFAAGLVLGDVTQARTSKTVETQDAAGRTVNVTTYDLGDEVTIQMRPAGTTRALAKAANDLFPRPGGYAALISAADISHVDSASISQLVGGISGPAGATPTPPTPEAAIEGRYGIKEASKASTPTGPVIWTLTLWRVEAIQNYKPLA